MYKKICLLFLSIVATSCVTPQKSHKEVIVTGLMPVASIIEYLVEDMFVVEALIPNNTDPHHYNLKPSDAIKVANASLVFVLDKHFDGGLILDNQQTNSVFILNSVYENHNHDLNPHVWISFLHSIDLVNQIAGILSEKYPEKKDSFTKRKQSYIAQLNKKYQEMLNLYKSNNKNLYVVQRHHVWDLLLEELGIELIGVVEEYEGEQPSLNKIIKIIQTIKKYPIENVILIDDAFSQPSKALQQISQETGVKIKSFNPMQSPDSKGQHIDILSTYSQILSD